MPASSRSSKMVITSIQDRTAEFREVLAQAQKRQNSKKAGGQRQTLLTDAQRRDANGTPNGHTKGGRKGGRSEFARRAAEIGRGITGTMEKLQRLAQRMWNAKVLQVARMHFLARGKVDVDWLTR